MKKTNKKNYRWRAATFKMDIKTTPETKEVLKENLKKAYANYIEALHDFNEMKLLLLGFGKRIKSRPNDP